MIDGNLQRRGKNLTEDTTWQTGPRVNLPQLAQVIT